MAETTQFVVEQTAIPSPDRIARIKWLPLDPGLLSFINANRKYLWITGIGSLCIFIVFKLLYPYPDFISDSYCYIWAAETNAAVSLWPVGYAKFLRLIHGIWYYDSFLIGVQYLFFQSILLYLFYTISFFYNPAKNTTNIIFYALLFNPVTIFLSNCVLSDALFGGLTILWLVNQLWMIRNPKRYHILTQSILIGLLFTIRYTAIYYPIITAVSYLLSVQPIKIKFIGIVSPWLLIIPFILFTQQKTKEITGTAQFSVFGGWQIANNALYMYQHIDVDNKTLPKEFQLLDQHVKGFFNWAPPGYVNLDNFPGTYFIKHFDAPLKQYWLKHSDYENDAYFGYASWGQVSPLYQRYGNYLIKHHPISYIQHYILLNAKNYFDPYLEKFYDYNVGGDSVGNTVKNYFKYPSAAVGSVNVKYQQLVFFSFPSIWMVLNFFYLLGIIKHLLDRRKNRYETFYARSIILITIFLIVNFLFSISATPVVFRYEIIPFFILIIYSSLFLEGINKFKNKKEQAYEH